jgi:hypothetical protein
MSSFLFNPPDAPSPSLSSRAKREICIALHPLHRMLFHWPLPPLAAPELPIINSYKESLSPCPIPSSYKESPIALVIIVSLETLYPHLSAIVRRSVWWQRSPSTSPPTRGSLATKQSRSRWWHHREPSQAPATSRPRCKDDYWAAFSGPQR